MSDKMREALKCLLALHDNRVDTADAWNKAMEEAREALAEQPAQGEANMVTRASAINALRHLERHNGTGRATEAIGMLASGSMPSVPDGWKLVPVEPTMGMYDDWLAARKSQDGIAGWQAGYAAMLAAAPEVPR